MRGRGIFAVFAACLLLIACDSSTGPVLAPAPAEGTVQDSSKGLKKGTGVNSIAKPKTQVSPD